MTCWQEEYLLKWEQQWIRIYWTESWKPRSRECWDSDQGQGVLGWWPGAGNGGRVSCHPNAACFQGEKWEASVCPWGQIHGKHQGYKVMWQQAEALAAYWRGSIRKQKHTLPRDSIFFSPHIKTILNCKFVSYELRLIWIFKKRLLSHES